MGTNFCWNLTDTFHDTIFEFFLQKWIKHYERFQCKNILHISSSFNTEEVSKNSKGQVELYKSTINVNLQIKNINNQIIQKRNFVKDFTYNNKQNKFDLAQYQSSIKDDLINKIVSDTIIFLNSEW